ncbi:MAG: transcriptional repressor [Oscillospiraceae bacterium]
MTERHTMQKDMIYSSLCALANHPTAESVYEHVRTSCPSISRATVYRVLNQLARNGTIRKISMANGADRFDHRTNEHHHARCTCCGKVFDVPAFRLNIPSECLALGEEIQITGYSLQFYGICGECGKKKKECS